MVFCHPTVAGGRRPLPPKMGDRMTHPAVAPGNLGEFYELPVKRYKSQTKAVVNLDHYNLRYGISEMLRHRRSQFPKSRSSTLYGLE